MLADLLGNDDWTTHGIVITLGQKKELSTSGQLARVSGEVGESALGLAEVEESEGEQHQCGCR